MGRLFLQTVLCVTLAGMPTRALGTPGQDSGQKEPDKRPDNQPDSKQPDGQQPGESSSSSSSPGAAEELERADQAHNYNPLPAEKDVEVGEFYMHKGDLNAAITRFEDAIQLRSNYAKPRLLLAQIYEKKGDKTSAAKYYKEYLEVYPHAPDAKKVQEKIAKLGAH